MEAVQTRNPVNPIPPTLQNLYADLDFLSQVKRGLKPCCSAKVLSDNDWTGSIYRTLKYWTTGECKEKVVKDVKHIVATAVEAITNNRYSEHLQLTINYLDRARPGIESLKHTYSSHPNTISDINVILADIDIQLRRYSHLIRKSAPELNEDNDVPEVTTKEPRGKEPRDINTKESKEVKEVKEVKENKESKESKETNPFQPESSLPSTPIVLSDSTESISQSAERKNFNTKKFNKNKKTE